MTGIEAVKAHNPLRAYLAEHGVEFVRNKARCPFHEDKTPSFSLYPGKDGYERGHCFGCGKDVDVIGAAQELHGLDTRGALKFLADRAGIKTGRQTPAEVKAIEKARQERERKAALVERFRAWERDQVDYLSAMLRAFRSMKARARTESELVSIAEMHGVMDELEHVYEDILCRKDDAAKFELYREMDNE